jgi:hypothetical protein
VWGLTPPDFIPQIFYENFNKLLRRSLKHEEKISSLVGDCDDTVYVANECVCLGACARQEHFDKRAY